MLTKLHLYFQKRLDRIAEKIQQHHPTSGSATHHHQHQATGAAADTEKVKKPRSKKSAATPRGSAAVGRDDFIVLKLLGQGSFAKVFLVRKIDTGKLYAMKVVPKARLLRSHRLVRNLFSERNVLKQCDHPFVMKLHFTFQSEHQLFLVMDYFENGDLEQLLNKTKPKRMREAHAQAVAAEIVLALEHLHAQGVVYRDLKPSNILLDRYGHVCLADLGLCRVFDPSVVAPEQRRCTSFVGSPLYVAPEILLGRKYGQTVDWWAFGVLLFRMLCGEMPFDAEQVPKIFDRILRTTPSYESFPWLSAPARDLLQKLLEKDECKRLSGATDVKSHPFFASISWSAVLDCQTFKPTRTSPAPPSLSSSSASLSPSCGSSNSRPSYSCGSSKTPSPCLLPVALSPILTPSAASTPRPSARGEEDRDMGDTSSSTDSDDDDEDVSGMEEDVCSLSSPTDSIQSAQQQMFAEFTFTSTTNAA